MGKQNIKDILVNKIDDKKLIKKFIFKKYNRKIKELFIDEYGKKNIIDW